VERRKAKGLVPYKIAVGRSRKIRVVGAGNYHSFAVDDHGDVWGWGMNSMGQTGTGLAEKSVTDVEVQAPKKVVGLSKEELGGETVVQIAGGDHHTLFLTSGGKVYACGRANGGQLGLAEDHPALKDAKDGAVSTPTLVEFPDAEDPVVQIAAGTHNNLAVTKGGALYGWGSGQQSELGLGDEEEVKTPTIIVRKTGGSFAAMVASCGGQHALGLFRKKT
jgi:regulator of chromosome condensation